MNKKGVGTIFGAICGLTALTAISAEVFYDFSINKKSPIHMSKLNNLVQKATNTNGSEEDASAKYSGLTGAPEMKKWYGENGEDVYIMSDSLRLHGKLFKNPGTKYALVCHGYTSKAKHMAGFINKFHSLSYNVLHIPWFPVLNASSAISKVRDGYDFKQASAVEQVKKSHIPTLFIHGSKDELVPYGMLNELYSAANCEKEILTIQGAGHALSSSVAPELYWNTVETFLKKHLD